MQIDNDDRCIILDEYSDRRIDPEKCSKKTADDSTREGSEAKRDEEKLQEDGERTPSQQFASGLHRHGEPSL